MSDETRRACPDDGKCHHGCRVGCYRVEHCGPLTGQYDGDVWPESVTSLAAEEKRLRGEVSALLDEVYALRLLVAYEAEAMEASLDYKTFPKSRRGTHLQQVARLQAVARGRESAQAALERLPSGSLRGLRDEAGLTVMGNWRNNWQHITPDESGEPDG